MEVVVKHEKRAASSSVPNQQSKTPGRPPEQGNPPAGPEMDFPLDAKSVTLTKCGLTQVPPRYVCMRTGTSSVRTFVHTCTYLKGMYVCAHMYLQGTYVHAHRYLHSTYVCAHMYLQGTYVWAHMYLQGMYVDTDTSKVRMYVCTHTSKVCATSTYAVYNVCVCTIPAH